MTGPLHPASPSHQHCHPATSWLALFSWCSSLAETFVLVIVPPPNRCRTFVGGSVGTSRSSDSEVDRSSSRADLPVSANELAPVPGWVRVVQLASAAAAASDPPASFLCKARWGRLSWYDVRGSRAFVE